MSASMFDLATSHDGEGLFLFGIASLRFFDPSRYDRADESHRLHQENVIYYSTLQTTTEHYVVLCSKTQPTDVQQRYC
jgi:hypothetical protein